MQEIMARATYLVRPQQAQDYKKSVQTCVQKRRQCHVSLAGGQICMPVSDNCLLLELDASRHETKFVRQLTCVDQLTGQDRFATDIAVPSTLDHTITSFENTCSSDKPAVERHSVTEKLPAAKRQSAAQPARHKSPDLALPATYDKATQYSPAGTALKMCSATTQTSPQPPEMQAGVAQTAEAKQVEVVAQEETSNNHSKESTVGKLQVPMIAFKRKADNVDQSHPMHLHRYRSYPNKPFVPPVRK